MRTVASTAREQVTVPDNALKSRQYAAPAETQEEIGTAVKVPTRAAKAPPTHATQPSRPG
jgi:hypothetical protein